MSTNMEALRNRVFESNDRGADPEDGGIADMIKPTVDSVSDVEVKRYVDVIEATLREGEGTYTGTIAQAKP